MSLENSVLLHKIQSSKDIIAHRFLINSEAKFTPFGISSQNWTHYLGQRSGYHHGTGRITLVRDRRGYTRKCLLSASKRSRIRQNINPASVTFYLFYNYIPDTLSLGKYILRSQIFFYICVTLFERKGCFCQYL